MPIRTAIIRNLYNNELIRSIYCIAKRIGRKAQTR